MREYFRCLSCIFGDYGITDIDFVRNNYEFSSADIKN